MCPNLVFQRGLGGYIPTGELVRQPPSGEPHGPVEKVHVEQKKLAKETQKQLSESISVPYVPAKVSIPSSVRHPASIVESAPMSAVEPPDVHYDLAIPSTIIKKGLLSDIQQHLLLKGL